MKPYREKSACCGCAACADACPVDAIRMVMDAEGFLYPKITAPACIRCGRCEKVCPMGKDTAGAQNLYFGAQAKAERENSSSGGVFPLLAGYVFQRQGVVYGAAFNEKVELVHQEARTPAELDPLRRTKYVQSNLVGVYRRIRSDLEAGKWLLFCGTPCQTHALIRFLEKPYARLITADLVCYGVPSPGLWRDYVRTLERRHGGKLTAFSFRDKRNRDNGHTCSYTVGGQEYAGALAGDLYCNLFFLNYTLRPSCYACPYCTVDRQSDFTLGDFWGIENVRPEMDDGMGTSLVILHTEKAREIWEDVKTETDWFSCEKEDVLQPRLREPSPAGRGRSLFMLLYRILPASAFFFLYEKMRKIGNIANMLWKEAKSIEWSAYRKRKRRQLKSHDFTIIASNCVGAFIYQDLGLKYRTPTVGLTISMRDLVKMTANLREYMEKELVESREEGPFPIGLLGDVKVIFVHYKSFDEGKKKWNERKKRINWDHIFILGSERDDCDYEVLQAFEKLPYPKVVFTHIEYPEFSSAYHIKGFEEKEELGTITNFKPQILRRRYMDEFDYVAFLNKGELPG